MSGMDFETLEHELDQLREAALAAIAGATDLNALAEQRVHWLGKKGRLTGLLKSVGRLPAEDRPRIGKRVNEVKQALAHALEAAEARLREAEEAARIEAERIDVTLPGRMPPQGAVHPVRRGLDEIAAIFARMGFEIAEGPEIEDEFHNFDALNIPPEHPARAMHDTFFFPDGRLLRTHTSPVQIRAMRAWAEAGGEPPVAVVAPG
ncbi:MAG: phenylalanine--tRNA ligase subunit alpha, partial [Mariprofundaceae bacterium]